MSTQEQVLEEVSIEDLLSDNSEIVLFNDDHNTFDHVIKTLMTVCKHTSEQAEQCSLIVHYNGKCGVKTGSLSELKPICSSLLDAGLSVEIQ
ncbi:MAG: ATP-dependent Clp protease adaptor ClpS [Flavobacterium sp.]|nr:ATP-dependent Clp protease adaptor ClpS [Candidatus Neoflavobacterium equi]